MMREKLIENFLATSGQWGDASRVPLPGDASFRRYERLTHNGQRAVLMESPPPTAEIRDFVRIAKCLSKLGYSVPDILAKDEINGLALVEDFGDNTYTKILASESEDEYSLYKLALDLLIDLHRRYADDRQIPIYDDELFLQEVALFVDWYIPAIRKFDLSLTARSEFLGLWKELLPVARQVPASLVLRDFHVDNLMRLSNRKGLRSCGLLDFQDAVVGPISYDLVSLLEDARRDVSVQLSNQLILSYLDAFPSLDRECFMTSYSILGAQRAMKILGIFTRLDQRDQKPGYLIHVPRVWRLLHADLMHPNLALISSWLDSELPFIERCAPDAFAREVL